MATEGVTAVTSRIRAIRSMLATDGRSDMASADVSFDLADAASGTASFEPFGDVYQAALAGVTQAQPSVPSLSSAPVRLLDSVAWRPAGGSISGGSVVPSPSTTAGRAASPVGASPSATPTGASVGQIGGFGKLAAPPELEQYGNGRIPTELLEPIGQGGHRLYAPAAQAWKACVEAARAEGVDLSITDSYRTYDQQVDLVRRKGLYSEGGYGATPGTSNHGWGLALDADVRDPRAMDWMRTNAWRFGFVEAVPREPWHWEFRPHHA
jgi:D-alanyl-D-alanine carboxypeptidase